MRNQRDPRHSTDPFLSPKGRKELSFRRYGCFVHDVEAGALASDPADRSALHKALKRTVKCRLGEAPAQEVFTQITHLSRSRFTIEVDDPADKTDLIWRERVKPEVNLKCGKLAPQTRIVRKNGSQNPAPADGCRTTDTALTDTIFPVSIRTASTRPT